MTLSRSDLYSYQNTSVAHILQRNGSMLWLDMGLGKTIITLTAIERLLDQYSITSALILAPLKVVEAVWEQEAALWDHTRRLKFSVVTGSPQDRLKALRTRADIYLTNYEQLQWLLGRKATKKLPATEGVLIDYWLKKGRRLPFDMVVFDEISRLKRATAKRSKAFAKILPQMTYRVGLTGTPAPNGIGDLHGQFLMVDGGRRLGPNITGFKNKWMVLNPFSNKWVPRRGATDQIKELVSDITLEMASKDYIELPPLVIQDIVLKLPAKIMKKYKEFEDEFFTEIGGSEVEAFNSGAKSMKCRQLANGACYLDQEFRSDWVEFHNEKLDAAEEIVQDLAGKPTLIAYQFKHDLERLLKRFPGATVLDTKNTAKKVVQWNAGEIEVLLCHPASAGHGLNLQKGGNHIIWFGLPWSLEQYQQTIARLLRNGQKGEVVINHRILVEKTIEMAVASALKDKDADQAALRNAVKEYRATLSL